MTDKTSAATLLPRTARRALFGALLGTTMLSASLAHAGSLPTGGSVAAGSASIASTANATTITQTSNRAVINWGGFSVGAGNSVTFRQPDAQSATLNRVTGSASSTIAGSISSNGAVYLVNPNGIAITQSGVVNTQGGFVASTLGITDANFMAGRMNFTGNGASKTVSNAGRITTGQGAYVALLGGAVANSGLITVPLGKLAMGSGEQIALDINGGNFMQVAVPSALVTGSSALVDNSGAIVVNGGAVQLQAAVLKDAVRNVINMSGSISADSAVGNGGTITLIGGSDTGHMAGTVTVSGTLSARATGAVGHGGSIETSGKHVALTGTQVSTLAAHGKAGNWLIDPVDFTIAASGGDITGAALSGNLAGGDITIQSSQGARGTNGDINVNDTVHWSANTLTLDAAGSINVNAVMNATGTARFAGIVGDTAQTGTGSASGALNFGLGSSGFYGTLNLAPAGGFSLNGNTYTIITTLGAQGSTTGTDLQGISSGYFALGSNIDASATSTWNSGAGFQPLSFTGNFQGLGHVVTGLTINRPGTIGVGLFGHVYANSFVSGIGVDGGSVTGQTSVGGLVGNDAGVTLSDSWASGSVTASGKVGGLIGAITSNSTITNVYATGAVSGGDSGSEIGGLIGLNSGGTVNNVYATGAVSGGLNASAIGGLVGGNGAGTISEAWASGTVTAGTGASDIGGLAGFNAGTISNVYASGAVSAASNATAIGGLIGNNSSGTLSNAWSSGAVTSGTGSSDTGGLIGVNTNTINNAYWDTYSSGQTSAVGGGSSTGTFAVTSDPNQSGAGYYAFRAGAYELLGPDWVLINGVRPMGAWEAAPVEGGTGFVSNAHQLQMINASNATLNGNYVLTNNLDLSATGAITTCTAASCTPGSYAGLWGSRGFVPLGLNSSSTVSNNGDGFNASFNGQGHTISGLTINRSDTPNVGLFGLLGVNGTVTGLGLEGGSVIGAQNVGELVGANHGTITESYATGTVKGITAVGGLVGSNGRRIQDAYAAGTVNATINGGGLVGENFGTITNTYAASSNGPLVAGLVGQNFGTINSSYYSLLTPVSGATNGTGVPPSALMQASTFTGWSMDTVGGQADTWRIYEGQTMPLLKVFLTTANVAYAPMSATYSGATPLIGTPTITLSNGATANPGLIQGSLTTTCSGGVAGCFHAGSYTLTGSGLYSGQQGYDLVATPGTLVITPAQLTLTAPIISGATTKTYDGTTAAVGASLTGGSVSGAVSGDTLSLDTSGIALNYNNSHVIGANSIGASGNLGIAITASGSGSLASDYMFTSPGIASVSASITPALLTPSLTSPGTSKVYDGTTATSYTPTYAFTGLVSGDTGASLSSTDISYNSSQVLGATAIGVSGLTIASMNGAIGSQASDYALSLQNLNTPASITARLLTIAANGASSTYGAGIPALTYSTGGMGLVSGDTLSGSLATDATAASNVGDYAITQGTLAAGANYAVTYTGANLAITPAPLTVTYTANGATGIYGNTVAGLSGLAAAPGLVNGDTLASLGSASWTSAVNSSSGVGAYAVTGSGLADANYAITSVQAPGNASAYSVSARPLSIAANGASSTYGSAIPALGYTTGGLGLVNGDALSGSLTTSATAASNVGSYAINQGTLAANSNYAVTYTGANLSITPASLTMTYTADLFTVPYGQSLPNLTGTATASGLVNGDTLAGLGAANWATNATAASPPGSYAINGSGLSSGNYAITTVQSASNGTALTITATAPLTATTASQSLAALVPLSQTSGETRQPELGTTDKPGAHSLRCGTAAAGSHAYGDTGKMALAGHAAGCGLSK